MNSHFHSVQIVGVVGQMNDALLLGAALSEDKAAQKHAEQQRYGQYRVDSLQDWHRMLPFSGSSRQSRSPTAHRSD
jgi:hypothetical protein